MGSMNFSVVHAALFSAAFGGFLTLLFWLFSKERGVDSAD